MFLPYPYAFRWVLFRVFSAVVSPLRLHKFSGLPYGSVLLWSQILYFQNFQCSIFSLLVAIFFFGGRGRKEGGRDWLHCFVLHPELFGEILYIIELINSVISLVPDKAKINFQFSGSSGHPGI